MWASPEARRRGAATAFLLGVCAMGSGCLATRDDLRVLQADIAVVRAEGVRMDSLRARQLTEVIGALRQTNDTLRVLAGRLGRWQGDSKEAMFGLAQQLISIQELTGQSQRRLQELRADLEERGRDASAVAAAAPVTSAPTAAAGAASAGPVAAPMPAAPGPNQLLQLSLDQLRRGSAGSARAGFEDLLKQYPTADVAPTALFYVAETFAQEGKPAQADSVYRAVVQRFPQAEKAPTALYKHALALAASGKTAEANAVFADVVKRYPRSDEAVLAGARVRDKK